QIDAPARAPDPALDHLANLHFLVFAGFAPKQTTLVTLVTQLVTPICRRDVWRRQSQPRCRAIRQSARRFACAGWSEIAALAEMRVMAALTVAVAAGVHCWGAL